MNEIVELPKYSQIYIINNKKNCVSKSYHNFVKKTIKIYNRYKSFNTETVFECSNCKKLFIVKDNKARFITSYPLYEICEDKFLNKRKTLELKKKTNDEEIKKELEKKQQEELDKKKKLELSNKNAKLNRLRTLMKGQRIVVLDSDHNKSHSYYEVSCNISDIPVKIKFCDYCKMFYCSKDSYYNYLKLGINAKYFIFKSELNKLSSTKDNYHIDFNLLYGMCYKDKKEKNKIKHSNWNDTKTIKSDVNQNNIQTKKERKKRSVIVKTKPVLNDININNILNKLNNSKNTFFLRTSLRKCENNSHNIIDLWGEIEVINDSGVISTQTVKSFYCVDCNLLFLYDTEYNRIKKKGTPLCQIYEYSKYSKSKDNSTNLNPESIIHSFGYNVGSIDNLSEKHRRGILDFIIENGICKKQGIIFFLKSQIKLKESNPRQKESVKKWKSDVSYLESKHFNPVGKVKINTIKITKFI